MLNSLMDGIVVGLMTGMPLGVIGAICLRITLTYGPIYGFSASLGSCVADSMLGTIAVLGMGFIINLLHKFNASIHFIGGIIIFIVGITTYFSKDVPSVGEPPKKTLVGAFTTTLLLGLANPTTIFSFMLVITALNVHRLSVTKANSIPVIILGIFIGSLIWWILFIPAAGFLHKKMTSEKLHLVNKILGVGISSFGLITVFKSLTYYIFRNYRLPLRLFELFSELVSL